MPDLKLDAEVVIARIGRAVDSAIDGLRNEAERIIKDVREVAAVLSTPTKLDIASSDCAVVIDFHNNYGGKQIELVVGGGGNGGYAQLAHELPKGRYRAIILLNKIDEPAGR